MNLVGIAYGLSCIFKPSRLLPSLVIDEFSDIPYNLSEVLANRNQPYVHDGKKRATSIRALVLDKDNCFAKPHELTIWPKYQVESIFSPF